MIALKVMVLPLLIVTLNKIYEMYLTKDFSLFWYLFKGVLVAIYFLLAVWSVQDFCELLLLILIESFLIVSFAETFRNFFAIFLLFSFNSPGFFSIMIGKSSVESLLYMTFDEKVAAELAAKAVKNLKKHPKTTKALVFSGITYYGIKGCVNSWDTFLNTQYILPGEKRLEFLEKEITLYKMRVESKDTSLTETDLKVFQENTKTYKTVNADVYAMKRKRWF